MEKHIVSSHTLNNRFILQAYKKEALRAKEQNGFAFLDQKTAVKGLKVLVNAKLTDGTVVLAGSIAYIKEESLHNMPWAQKSYTSDFVNEPFIIVDATYVEYVLSDKSLPNE